MPGKHSMEHQWTRIAAALVCLSAPGGSVVAGESTESGEKPAGQSFDNMSFDYRPESRDKKSFWSPATFTLAHEVAANPDELSELVNNRSSARIEFSRDLFDNFYVRVDTKLTAFLNDDHRAEAAGDGVLYETFTRDGYLQFSKGDHSITAGRKIVVWGESELGAITDVVSPRNFSELFFTTLEKSRLGQTMLSYNWFSSVGTWNTFVVPDPRFNRYPEPGTAYDVDRFGGAAQVIDRKDRHTEFGIRWKKTVSNNDIRFMAARLVDNDPVLRREGMTDGGVRLAQDEQRFDMLGLVFNYSTGSTLLAGEVAGKSPLAFNTQNFDVVEKDVVDAALRAEQTLGNGGNHSIGLEFGVRHVADWSEELVSITPDNAYSAGLIWSNTFFNDNLSMNLVSVYERPYESLQHSLFVTYDVNDRVSVNLDMFYLAVSDERNELYPFRDNDNMVFRFLYQF